MASLANRPRQVANYHILQYRVACGERSGRPSCDDISLSHRLPSAPVGVRSALISLSLFAQESAWSVYDAKVPPLVRHYVANAAVTGLHNVVGVFVQPRMGSRSDRTRTRGGRRAPYLVLAAPVAAALFALPAFATSPPTLLAMMFCYGLVANTYKPAVKALTPEFVAPVFHTDSAAVRVVRHPRALAIKVSLPRPAAQVVACVVERLFCGTVTREDARQATCHPGCRLEVQRHVRT